MRPRCDGCGRPLVACLCPAMPAEPIRTSRTTVIIMQHPLEARHKLTTVPVLARCLHPDSCEVLQGRSFRRGSSSRLDLAIDSGSLILLLFPGEQATDLSAWHRFESDQQQEQQPAHLVLLVVDATWQHAKEMIRASEPFLKDHIAQVSLPFDKNKQGLGMGSSGLILRKEPFDGYMSTMEAVTRALAVLEPSGPQIEQALLPVLQRMVSLQTLHLKKPS